MSYIVDIKSNAQGPASTTLHELIQSGHRGFIDIHGRLFLICHNSIVNLSTRSIYTSLTKEFIIREFCSITVSGDTNDLDSKAN
jgi:hypothetical protein